jgi:hypothetical protein
MTILINLRSPERAWEPFMEWLRDQGIEPGNCRVVEVDETAMTAEVTECKRDIHGKKYLQGDEVATEERTVRISSLPPLHPSRTADLPAGPG